MKTLIIAPHPDDEILGCGGFLLRRIAEGHEVRLVIVTEMPAGAEWDDDARAGRDIEIRQVSALLGLQDKHVVQLGFPAAALDQIATKSLIERVHGALIDFAPQEVLVPHSGDIHSDHQIIARVATSCTKWFRSPSVTRILAYETLSETGLGYSLRSAFLPTLYVDISPWLEQKLNLLESYSSELGTFPFPRSHEAVEALARFRGSESGFTAAEAFEVLRQRE